LIAASPLDIDIESSQTLLLASIEKRGSPAESSIHETG
jgi:hypothetical protein